MPKRILAFLFAAAALALAACNNNSSLYTVAATPTASATPTPIPNPSASTAFVHVTYSSSPLPNQPVMVSTADPNGHAGAVMFTQNTDATGKATFSNLTPQTTYCFWSTYPQTGSLAETVSIPCTNLWGNGTGDIYIAF